MKAAKSLDPMVPLYAVDCDAEENKRICAEQVRSLSRCSYFLEVY